MAEAGLAVDQLRPFACMVWSVRWTNQCDNVSPPETEENVNARPCLSNRGTLSIRTGRRRNGRLQDSRN